MFESKERRRIGKQIAIGMLGLGIAASSAAEAQAQELQGVPAVHGWSVPGVAHPVAETFFSCTNTLSAPVLVGVELVEGTGAVVNDASASAREVPAGGTATFGTFAVFLGIPVDSELCSITGCPTSSGFLRGFARILVTASFKDSSRVLCTATVASPRLDIPALAYHLPVIRVER